METKSADRFSAEDFADYFLRRAQELLSRRLLGTQPRRPLISAYKRVMQHFSEVPDYKPMLALATDRVLLTMGPQLGVTDRLVTVGIFGVAVKELGGYDQPWLARYYQRFAATQEQAQYFKQWLSVLEDSMLAHFGSVVFGFGEHSTWESVRLLAKGKLSDAVRAIKVEFKANDGYLPERWVGLPQLTALEIPAIVGRAKPSRRKRGANASRG